MARALHVRELNCDRKYSTVLSVGHGLCTSSSEELYVSLGSPATFQVVVDRYVYKVRHDLASAIENLKFLVKDISVLVCPGGEGAKKLERLSDLISWFDEKQVLRRSEPVVVIGGGALLDLVSFATTIYRRGIPCIRVPTSLLGMVDASLGAKNGINFKGRKNLVGTFSPAHRIIIDPAFLTSLSSRQLRSGVAEILKAAMIVSEPLFELMENSINSMMRSKFQCDEGLKAIDEAIAVMVNSIWTDLWESELRRPMDFGHSISKMFEEKLRPRPTHGEAVSLDMTLSAATASVMGLLSQHDLDRFLNLIAESGLPTDNSNIDDSVLEGAVADTRIHHDGDTSFPLPDRVGYAIFKSVSTRDLMNGQRYLRSRY